MINLKDVIDIANSRPEADHNVEQYLMTAESLRFQADLLRGRLAHVTSVLFLGDDDHLSVLLATQLSVRIVVVENDKRVMRSLKRAAKLRGLNNLEVVPHDLRYGLAENLTEQFDACILNPPYSSKNGAFGIKVWLSRAIQALKVNGIGLAVLPIQAELPWSLTNMVITQSFLSGADAAIVSVQDNLHTYYDLPDVGLMSSNIWFVKTRELETINENILGDIPLRISLYR